LKYRKTYIASYMIDIPPEYLIKCIKSPSILRFTDRTHANPKYRYHLIIPLKGSEFLKCTITSKIEKREHYYKHSIGSKYAECLVYMSPSKYKYFSKDSVVNCHTAKHYESAIGFVKDLKNSKKLEVTDENLPRNFIDDVKRGILLSPETPDIIKSNVQLLK